MAPAAALTPGDFVALLRPSQWVKNVVVFAGPAAGLRLLSPEAIGNAALAFVAFCLAASATYAINDAVDHKADACHAEKRMRPVARGAIAPVTAITIGIVLFAIAIMLSAVMLPRSVAVVVALYFCLTLSYSLALKRAVLIDVIIIATGFIFRAWAGALAVVPWIHAFIWAYHDSLTIDVRRFPDAEKKAIDEELDGRLKAALEEFKGHFAA